MRAVPYASLGFVFAGLAATAAGCAVDDPTPPGLGLSVRASWNRDPPSVDLIGYRVDVSIGITGRADICTGVSPRLRVTVNDRETGPIVAGPCEGNVEVIVPAVATDTDTVVKLLDGHAVIGLATYRGLFPGLGATAVASPPEASVRGGEKLTLSIPPGWLLGDGDQLSTQFYWLDTPAQVPPFHTSAVATRAPANSSAVETTAPVMTGRALLVAENLERGYDSERAAACTGFSGCQAWPSHQTLGPVLVEVTP